MPPINPLTYMANNITEAIKQHKGTASRIRTILNYHYDQMIRDIRAELEDPEDFECYLEEAIGTQIDNIIEELQ